MKKRVFLLLFQLIVSIIIIILGILFVKYLIKTRPKVKLQKPEKKLQKVKVYTIVDKPYSIKLEEYGEVRPVIMFNITSQISGKIVYISDNLLEGKKFKKGELLIEIEKDDYELAVKSAIAAVKNAESNLLKMEEEAKIAKSEWKSYNKNKKPSPLTIKEPQLKAAKAQLLAAKANYEKALLNLKRTKIYAPYDGIVLEKNVELGQFISPGMSLASAYNPKYMEVYVSISERDLKFINIPGYNSRKKGSKCKIMLTEDTDKSWDGFVDRADASFDPQTKMLKVIIKVINSKEFPILPYSFVKVLIYGKKTAGFNIPFSAIKFSYGEKPAIWKVTNNNTLKLLYVNILYFDEKNALIDSKGLKIGDKVVISSLSTPANGEKVEIIEDKKL